MREHVRLSLLGFAGISPPTGYKIYRFYYSGKPIFHHSVFGPFGLLISLSRLYSLRFKI
ncbi:unnamed protein product [Arabidopsis halleri]